jgi:alpha-glucosidase
MRLYQMAGGGEGQGTLNNMLDMQDSLLAAGFSTDEITTKIIPGGEHNENLWRQDFGEAYLWLFASFASGIRAQEETRNIRLFPNPSGEIVNLPPDFPDRCDSVVVLNMQGQTVLKMSPFHGHALNVSSLPAGTYLVTIVSGKTLYQGKFVKE